ncbi:diguanylate cyclase [Leptospira wolffii]|uniref:diguanylate cyclase n=1 Tax=Leptospira wolffii TaxID=409998 RepID=A0ABV5BRE5_9LEPT|nr:sensor domain-containing diguanylate cyclase [Leptospira wolffii]
MISTNQKNYWIRSSNFLESVDEAVLIVDSKGKLIDSNPSAHDLGLVPHKNNVRDNIWYHVLSQRDPKEHIPLTLRTETGKHRFICRCIPVLMEEKEPAKAFLFRDITQQKNAESRAKRYETLYRRREAKVRELEIRDKLTGLFNRDYTIEAFRTEVYRAERTESGIGVVYFDIDRLKGINELYGTSKGDIFIQALAAILSENTRRSDIACRIGGEEFLLLLPGASRAIVLERAEKVRRLFSEFQSAEIPEDVRCSVSVGVAMYPQDGVNTDDLLHEVQAAVYIAKRSGRNRVVSTGT